MQCFNCGYKLDYDNTKACPLCGMKFAQKCYACGSPNPMLAKYCFNCGSLISTINDQELVSSSDKLAENRKNVAVIFADVSGFTALSEQMDPEKVREIINDCFDYITKPVYEFEGTIDKYIGDCVMILFGAKYAHYDDPKRAIQCAMKMQKLIKKYSQEYLSVKGIELDMSIGVNYGLVVTGKVGNYFDKDYTVMGDVVNTAQRLQSNAEKGTILVSESVYLETKDIVEYSDERQISVKNKKDKVKCYLPIAIKNTANNYSSLLIGRDSELNDLNRVYKDISKKCCITIIGESGIGKTSILKSFLNVLDDNILRVWIDCNLSYQSRVYHTIASIIFNIIDTHYTETNEIKSSRLKTFIEYILSEDYSQSEIKRNIDFIGLLLGLKRDNDFQNILDSMKYQDIKEEILNQLNIFFENLLKKNEAVIIIDGLHWVDNSSLEIIKELISRNAELRNIFIFSSRYELDAFSLGDEKNYVLKLERLDDEKIKLLICALINNLSESNEETYCNDIDNSVFELIKRFTNGNPLYVVELINSIKRKEQYYLRYSILYIDKAVAGSLPDNIEKLMLENISEFDERTLEFLEVAAVIGKNFSLSWIKNLINDFGDYTEVANFLMERNIISLDSVQLTSGVADRRFKFNEDLTREVIYKSILNKRKKEIHNSVGEFIEVEYSKELENYFDILAYHFEKSGLDNKARKYCYKSAVKYKNNFILNDALQYYERYIENIDIGKGRDLDIEITRALMDMGYIYSILTDHENALLYLNKALQVAVLSDDIYITKIMIATIYKEQGLFNEALDLLAEISLKIRPTDSIYGKLLQLKCNILRITGNSEVLHLVEESESILMRKKDYESLSETMNAAGILYFIKGDVDNSTYYLNKAYEYAEKINNYKIMAKVSGNLGVIYYSSGLISKALKNINKTIEISKKISNIMDYIGAINNLGIIYIETGLFNKAESLFNESIGESRKRSLPYQECISLINLADTMFEKCDNEASLSLYSQSNQLAHKYKLPVEEGIYYLGISKLNFNNKEYEKGLSLLEKSYEFFKEADEISYICEYHRYMSIYELIHSRLEQALVHCEQSLELAIEAKSDNKKLKGLRIKGFILAEMGEYDDALNMLDESIKLSYQLESNYEVAKGYYQKFIVLYKQNLKQEAQELLLKANEVIQMTDKNRWTTIIETTLNDIKTNSFKFKFVDI